MDANRFDDLSRTLAARSNRREAVRRGGVLAAVAGAFGLGGARAIAQDDADEQETTRCQVAFRAVVTLGDNEGATFEGLLTLRIGAEGAIDDGELETEGPRPYQVVGQATGRTVSLRIDVTDDTALALTGVGERDVRDCRGKLSGTFAGPEFGDSGVWEAERIRSATPTPAPDEEDVVDDPSGDGGSGDGGSGGSGSDEGSSEPTSTPCAEEDCGGGAFVWNPETCACECYEGGEACGEICCPGGSVCDEAASTCACPPGTVLCGNTCVSECAPGSTLDFTACTCTEGCPSGQVLCGGACVGPCASGETLNTTTCLCDPLCPPGQEFCSGACIDIVNDRNNCGSCGNVCLPGVPCIAGTCQCPATTKYCANVQMCKDENATC